MALEECCQLNENSILSAQNEEATDALTENCGFRLTAISCGAKESPLMIKGWWKTLIG